MSTLKQKANSILDEKNEKIIPENIKKDVIIFDVEGTLEGIDTSDATATADDLAQDATAYVNGVKISGSLRDYRETSSVVNFLGDISYVNQQNEAVIMTYEAGSSASDMIISNKTILNGQISCSKLASDIGLTANILKKNETVLGVVGTLETGGIDTSDATAIASDIINGKTAYVDGEKITGTYYPQAIGNNNITFLEAGDIISIDLQKLANAISNLDDEDKALELVLDGGCGKEITIKFADAVNVDNLFEESGLGLAINEDTSYFTGNAWVNNFEGNFVENAFKEELELKSYAYSDTLTVGDLPSILEWLTNTGDAGSIVFTYPNNVPVLPIFITNTFQLYVDEGCGALIPKVYELPDGPIITVTKQV